MDGKVPEQRKQRTSKVENRAKSDSSYFHMHARGDEPQSQQADPEPRISFACPLCHAKVTAPLRAIGRHSRCPYCQQTIQVPQLPEPEPLSEATLRKPPPLPPVEEPPARAFADVAASVKPNPPPLDTMATPVIQTSPRRQSPVPQKEISGFFKRWANRYPRSFYQMAPGFIIFTPLLVPAAWFLVSLIALANEQWSFGFKGLLGSLVLGFVWLLIGTIVANGIVHNYLIKVPTVRCPGCGDHLSLVGKWSCACGYHDHRERHFYEFECPKCKGSLGCFDCPHCDSTIMLK